MTLPDTSAIADAECAEGYSDGRNTDSPKPGSNRSSFYKHGFEVGRAERSGKPIPAAVSREGWAKLLARNTKNPPPA